MFETPCSVAQAGSRTLAACLGLLHAGVAGVHQQGLHAAGCCSLIGGRVGLLRKAEMGLSCPRGYQGDQEGTGPVEGPGLGVGNVTCAGGRASWRRWCLGNHRAQLRSSAGCVLRKRRRLRLDGPGYRGVQPQGRVLL